MKEPRAPIFLDRRSYRERRMMDALRLLPILALLLWLLPLFWPTGDIVGNPVPMSVAVTYVFGVWLLMICVALVLSRYLRRRLTTEIEATKQLRDE